MWLNIDLYHYERQIYFSFLAIHLIPLCPSCTVFSFFFYHLDTFMRSLMECFRLFSKEGYVIKHAFATCVWISAEWMDGCCRVSLPPVWGDLRAAGVYCGGLMWGTRLKKSIWCASLAWLSHVGKSGLCTLYLQRHVHERESNSCQTKKSKKNQHNHSKLFQLCFYCVTTTKMRFPLHAFTLKCSGQLDNGPALSSCLPLWMCTEEDEWDSYSWR